MGVRKQKYKTQQKYPVPDAETKHFCPTHFLITLKKHYTTGFNSSLSHFHSKIAKNSKRTSSDAMLVIHRTIRHFRQPGTDTFAYPTRTQ